MSRPLSARAIRFAGWAAVLVALAWSAAAHADAKQACVEASTEGQSMRDAGKLRDARDRFVTCARDECPAIVRKYCAEWLTDVEKRIPSLILRAKSESGVDLTDASVTIDHGAARILGGTAVEVDPGEHALRFERQGSPPVDARVVVIEGERGRVVTARFGTPPNSNDVGADASSRGRPSPWSFVLGGVGIVGIAGFAYFGITAKDDLDNLRHTCAPVCATSDLDAVKQKALIADISLGVGLVALGAATVVFFTSREGARGHEAASLVDVHPVRGGAMFDFAARF